MSFFARYTPFVSGGGGSSVHTLVDTGNVLSVDGINRKLIYADGTTDMLDWGNANQINALSGALILSTSQVNTTWGTVQGLFLNSADYPLPFQGNLVIGSTDVTSGFSPQVTILTGENNSTGASSDDTGPVNLYTGDQNNSSSTGNTGSINIDTGFTAGSGATGAIVMNTGGTLTGSSTGQLQLISGLCTLGSSGEVDLITGNGSISGNILLQTGNATSGNSGSITLQTGSAGTAGGAGGIILEVGSTSGSGQNASDLDIYGGSVSGGGGATAGGISLASGSDSTTAGGSRTQGNITLSTDGNVRLFQNSGSSTPTYIPSLQFFESTSSFYSALQASSSLAASYTLTLPTTAGNNGQALITNGSGVLSWATQASITLNNLSASTAVNQSILPASGGAIDLGSSAKQWRHVFSNSINVTTITTLGGTGSVSVSNPISMTSNNITTMADPLNPQDAATKNYVDTKVTGASGTFTTADSKTVTVSNGLITSIV